MSVFRLLIIMTILFFGVVSFASYGEEMPLLQEGTIGGLTLNNQGSNIAIWFDGETLPKEYQNPERYGGTGLNTSEKMNRLEGIEQIWVDGTLRTQVTVNYARFSSPQRAQNAVRVLACNMSIPIQSTDGGLIQPMVKKLTIGDLSYTIDGGRPGHTIIFCTGAYAFCVEAYDAEKTDLFIGKIMEKLKR
jgi:hypothetical protein